MEWKGSKSVQRKNRQALDRYALDRVDRKGATVVVVRTWTTQLLWSEPRKFDAVARFVSQAVRLYGVSLRGVRIHCCLYANATGTFTALPEDEDAGASATMPTGAQASSAGTFAASAGAPLPAAPAGGRATEFLPGG